MHQVKIIAIFHENGSENSIFKKNTTKILKTILEHLRKISKMNLKFRKIHKNLKSPLKAYKNSNVYENLENFRKKL